jgi:hypothetical protein
VRWRFTDRALFFAPWSAILTLKAGSLEEYSLLERWGEFGRVPAALPLAACVEAARWLIEASSDFTLSGDPAEIACWNAVPGLRPGERFCAFLRVEGRDDTRVRFAVRQRVMPVGALLPDPASWEGQGAEWAGSVLTCALTPLAARCSPADRAILWREIAP